MTRKRGRRLPRDLSPAKRCAHFWERRGEGKRYVYARGQCKRTTRHPSGYCATHRYSWRWPPPPDPFAEGLAEANREDTRRRREDP